MKFNIQPRHYGYVRVSTEKQNLSPEVQRDTITKAAAALGLTIDAWYQDAPVIEKGKANEAVSGNTPMHNRRAGRELCNHVRKDDHIFMAKLDRGFRSLRDFCNVMDEWEKLGVHLHICDLSGGFDISSPMGKAMLQMLVVFAELERKMIGQRTKEGMAGTKRKCYLVSKYPGYGFTWEFRTVNGKQKRVKIPCPEERADMADIVEWNHEGFNWFQIQAHLIDLGRVTKDGKLWSRNRIRRAFLAELQIRYEEAGGKSLSEKK